ncbi:hypothetical protein J8281_16780 [Aquimarina sp. U1-2]|uniref:hypothetical protein n=1 Tax=Aquimarina sp. U1-2 TaxID=2823141 RepID=UPI001AECC89F|nr:hypothetical protein [Aquimarina sp. U1-2]MBP2833853.1 hypothetical protein [Aquimarina sp. U1-2]
MYTKQIFALIIIFSIFANGQDDGVDVIAPQKASFSTGQNLEGWVKSAINEPTGKVAFSQPITSIAAHGVAYSLSLTYNGDAAFKTGQYTNRYAPTSTVGVGFSIQTPKIVVDNKNTATQEDDTFYLLDGASNTQLKCTGRQRPGTFQEGSVIWSFEAEKYIPYKIQYFKSRIERHFGGPLGDGYHEIPLDLWVITDDKGMKYYYGETQNSRENVVAWGNWIGNSNQPGGKRATTVWNLSTIEDQWDNSLKFRYLLQESSIGGVPQTEAAYLQKISSSTGEEIRIHYETKYINEYFQNEPNREQPEPDAYQERYETKYISEVTTYDRNDKLIFTYDLAYETFDQGNDHIKRYLTAITQKDTLGTALPAQKFEYFTSGDFQGGLKKIIQPTGGFVEYTYQNQPLFTNTPNRFVGSAPDFKGYKYHSMVVKNNYSLLLVKETTIQPDGHHRFKVVRHTWNGKGWVRNSFLLPYTIYDNAPGVPRLENFYTTFGDDFYAFLYHKGVTATVHLFHRNADGHTWGTRVFTTEIGPGYPKFMSGENFVAVGSETGKLDTYTWDNHTWTARSKKFNEGLSYYYSATNNFVLILDEPGGPDDSTGTVHWDNYYIHYLDLEGNWNTKSWSARMEQYLQQITHASYFYPNNAMTGFVAENNPEYFLRWDKNYNLIAADNVLGSYNDHNPITPTYSGMFVMQNGTTATRRPYKLSRFNGVDWNIYDFATLGSFRAMPTFAEDAVVFQDYGTSDTFGVMRYSANTQDWYVNTNLDLKSGVNRETGTAKDFFVAGNKIYNFSRNINRVFYDRNLTTINNHKNKFSYSDGFQNVFTEISEVTDLGGGVSSLNFLYSLLINVDKKTNAVRQQSLGAQYHPSSMPKFAGYTPFLSNNSLWVQDDSDPGEFTSYLYRIIEGEVNTTINDIVVSSILVNDNEGYRNMTSYLFEEPDPTADHSSIFYGKVTIAEKGRGTFNNGKVVKKYDTGAQDVRRAGLLLEEEILNAEGTPLAKNKNTWQKYTLGSIISTVFKLKQQENITFYEKGAYTATTTHTYDRLNFCRLSSSTTKDSKGKINTRAITYASEIYPFMKAANFISQPYETTTRLNLTKEISANRTIWEQRGNTIVPASSWMGTSKQNLRKISENIKFNTKGLVEETSNGKGQYSTVLYGYETTYPVATISNLRYDDVVANLELSVAALQHLDNQDLKRELMKLYDKLPKAFIEITLYDTQGKIIESIDSRKQKASYAYDTFNRNIETLDHNDHVLERRRYNYKHASTRFMH